MKHFNKSRKISTLQAMIVSGLLVIPVIGFTQNHSTMTSHSEHATSAPTIQDKVGGIYPLDTCPVSGEKLGTMGDPIVKTYEGREIRLCCKGCVSKFESNPEEYLSKIDAEIKAQQIGRYPVKYDVVDPTQKLPEDLTKAESVVVGNRLFLLSNAENAKVIQSNPAKFISMLDAAVIETQSPVYPMETCLVSGDKLGGDMGEPINYVYNGKLIELCCKGCIKMFEKNPQAYMDKMPASKMKMSMDHNKMMDHQMHEEDGSHDQDSSHEQKATSTDGHENHNH